MPAKRQLHLAVSTEISAGSYLGKGLHWQLVDLDTLHENLIAHKIFISNYMFASPNRKDVSENLYGGMLEIPPALLAHSLFLTLQPRQLHLHLPSPSPPRH